MHRPRALGLGTLVLSVCSALWGQSASANASPLLEFQGENVVSVELAGRPDLAEPEIEPLLQQKANTPLDPAEVQSTVAALEQHLHLTGIVPEVRPEPNGIRLLLIPQEAIYFGIYSFPGAEKFSYTRLLQVADYSRQEPYLPGDLATAQAALLKYFQRDGYFQASVQTLTDTDAAHGIANIRFAVALGGRAKFGQLILAGATPAQAQQLQSAATSIWARLHRAAIRPGKTYSLSTLQSATRFLRGQLAGEGHLAAQVRLTGAQYHADTNRADVHMQVTPGPVVKVTVTGAHLWPWTKHGLIPLYSSTTESYAAGGAGTVDPELIQEGQQALVSKFESSGYFSAQVTVSNQQQADVDAIAYRVVKGPRHKVTSVTIGGNRTLSDSALMPQVAVKRAHIFSHGDYNAAEVRTSVSNLKAAYQAAGFSQARVEARVSQPGGNLAVHFQIEEGPRDTVASLTLNGNANLSAAQLAPGGLKLSSGQPFSQSLVNQDRNRILETYLDHGYLNATFHATATPQPGQPHRMQVVYTIVEGPLVRVAGIDTLGADRTQPRLLAQNMGGIADEKPLAEQAMLSAESQLYGTGVFDWAQVDPRQPTTDQSDTEVLAKVHESKRNNITYGLGFEYINRGGSIPSGTVAVPGLPPVGLPSNFKTSEASFYGPRGSFEYTLSNLRGKAESFSASLLAGRLDQRAAFSYTDPTFRWSKWTATASITGEHNGENPIFTAREAQFELQLRRPLDASHVKNLLLQYSLSETGLTHLLIPALVPTADLHVRLSMFSATYTRDTRDNPLDAHKGQYQSLEADLNVQALGSSVSFGRLLGQEAYYRNVGKGIVWANSVRVGEEEAFDGSSVPLSQEFFTGGGSTLRGFPLDGAGPQRTIPACGDPTNPATCALIQVPVGGNELLIVNSEFRIPLPLKKGLGLAAFYDGGNVFTQPGFHDLGASYTNSVGIGLRYATPVGPIRIDLGHNLDHLAGIKSTQIFLTLGQAF